MPDFGIMRLERCEEGNQIGALAGSRSRPRARKQAAGVTSAKGCPEAEMAETKESMLEKFAMQAIAGGTTTLAIEYDEGYEEVYATEGEVGVGIGCRIPSSSEEAKSLRAELYAMGKRPRRLRHRPRPSPSSRRTRD